MDDLFNFETPIGILSIVGAAIGIHRLVTKTWIWNSLGRPAPVSRQLGPGRRPVYRPMARLPVGRGPMQAPVNQIGSVTTLTEGGYNAKTGLMDETISIIGR